MSTDYNRGGHIIFDPSYTSLLFTSHMDVGGSESRARRALIRLIAPCDTFERVKSDTFNISPCLRSGGGHTIPKSWRRIVVGCFTF